MQRNPLHFHFELAFIYHERSDMTYGPETDGSQTRWFAEVTQPGDDTFIPTEYFHGKDDPDEDDDNEDDDEA